jgi:hypothetical protein
MLVKPTFSILWNGNFEDNLKRTLEDLKKVIGDFDLISPTYHFPHLENYYSTEMGKPLKRIYLSGENLIKADPCSETLNPKKLKLLCMEIEEKYSVNGKRTVNVDPGWIDKYHLFLTTHKERGGRFYLGNGIFAEMEYLYFGGDFKDMFWTYEEYRKREVKDFFIRVRKKFLKQLKSMST